VNTVASLSKSEKHLAFLDIIRAVAILAVVCFHCFGDGFGYEFLPWGGQVRSFEVAKNSLWFLPISFGWAGVAIFFAVSGFCIHLSFAHSKTQSFRDFFIRRFFRI
jgi:peptidoglycan/LPS O-acetylase OafA/YrhL